MIPFESTPAPTQTVHCNSSCKQDLGDESIRTCQASPALKKIKKSKIYSFNWARLLNLPQCSNKTMAPMQALHAPIRTCKHRTTAFGWEHYLSTFIKNVKETKDSLGYPGTFPDHRDPCSRRIWAKAYCPCFSASSKAVRPLRSWEPAATKSCCSSTASETPVSPLQQDATMLCHGHLWRPL